VKSFQIMDADATATKAAATTKTLARIAGGSGELGGVKLAQAPGVIQPSLAHSTKDVTSTPMGLL
jgi:hypothetical protein